MGRAWRASLVVLLTMSSTAAAAGDGGAVADRYRERASRLRDREAWLALARLAGPDLKAGHNVAFWDHLARAADPVPLDGPELVLRVGSAYESARPLNVAYRTWALPAPGGVWLVGVPSRGEGSATIYAALEAGLRNAPVELARLRRVGADRAGLLLYRLGPNDAEIGTEIPAVEPTPEGVRIVAGGRAESVALSSLEEELGRAVGAVFEPPPPPEPIRLLVVVDWSAELAGSRPRNFFAELAAAVGPLESEQLWQGGVRLRTPAGSATWPLADLRAGREPPEMTNLAGHESRTRDNLRECLEEAAATGKPVRIVFVTWNPEVSIPEPRREMRYGEETERLAARLGLRIVQADGARRLPGFAQLAGGRYLDVSDRWGGYLAKILAGK